jgi:hypothetical protein
MFDRHDKKLIVFAFMAIFVSYCPLIWVYGGGGLHGPWHSVYVWEAWPKIYCFYIFGPFSWAIAHCFGFPRWFTIPMTHYMFERHVPKVIVFFDYGRFCELLPTVLGFRGDLQGQWHSVHVWEAWPKTHCFCVYGCFLSYAHNFGVPGWFTWPMTLSTCLRGMTKNMSF